MSTPTGQQQPDSPADSTMGLTIPDGAIIRIDQRYTVPALRAAVWASRSGGKVTGVELHFAVDRTDLPKFRNDHFGMDLDNVAILSLDPDLPVWITAEGRSDLVQKVAGVVDQGGSLEDLLGETGPSGFPLLLDLENYTFGKVVQEASAQAGSGGRP